MIAEIKDFNNKLFSLNGIKYVRNYQAIKIGDNVRVSSAYDTRFTLVNAHYSQFIINSNVYLSADSVVSVLSPLLFVKDELTMAEPGESTNNIGDALFSNINGIWINTPANPVTAIINLDLTGAVNGGTCAVYFKGATLTISGGTIIIQQNAIIPNELGLVWIVYDKQNNGFNVNIQTGFVSLPSTDAPEKMTITAIDLAQPEQMTITDIT